MTFVSSVLRCFQIFYFPQNSRICISDVDRLRAPPGSCRHDTLYSAVQVGVPIRRTRLCRRDLLDLNFDRSLADLILFEFRTEVSCRSEFEVLSRSALSAMHLPDSMCIFRWLPPVHRPCTAAALGSLDYRVAGNNRQEQKNVATFDVFIFDDFLLFWK